jgi:hypothetical protein
MAKYRYIWSRDLYNVMAPCCESSCVTSSHLTAGSPARRWRWPAGVKAEAAASAAASVTGASFSLGNKGRWRSENFNGAGCNGAETNLTLRKGYAGDFQLPVTIEMSQVPDEDLIPLVSKGPPPPARSELLAVGGRLNTAL